MIFFSSDHHFGHENIIKYTNRPFSAVWEMNDFLIAQWNDVVSPSDTVYYLGDFAMGKIVDTLPIAHRLNGKKFLVPGNHDRCWIGHGNKHKPWIEKYEKAGFEVLNASPEHPIELAEFTLAHFPSYGDHSTNERYAEWRPQAQTKYLLCGHIHNKWQRLDNMVNVGVDVWDYAPISIDVVRRTLNA